VLIDSDSPEGFECISQAREYLLKLGRKELEAASEASASASTDTPPISPTLQGSHVVAPCSHDKACPLAGESSKLVCGFSQRMQRPAFVRLTKHSKVGHEDVRYSYVVIQRGPRPEMVQTKVGRLGLVGTRAAESLAKKNAPVRQLHLFDASAEKSPSEVEANDASPAVVAANEEHSPEEVEKLLRQEAYHWPRLIFPPMKKSGHIILDGCTAEGLFPYSLLRPKLTSPL